MSVEIGSWWVQGSYFEACNCDAICPCRRVGNRDGGRSTQGHCDFALSWRIERGAADSVSLDELDVVLAGRYFDDETLANGRRLGEWEVVLYVDRRASRPQFDALTAIFLGRAGGSTFQNFAAAIGQVHAVRSATIRLEHARRHQRIEVPERIEVRVREPVDSDESITCAIPGHDTQGEEWVADRLRVDDNALQWDVEGKCSFASTFAYTSG